MWVGSLYRKKLLYRNSSMWAVATSATYTVVSVYYAQYICYGLVT